MSAHPAHHAVDLDPPAPPRPGLALALALLSIPGVTIVWDILPAGGFYTGVPLGIAAIVLGLQARKRLAGAKGTRMATTAVGLASLAVLSVVFFTIAGPPEDDAEAQAPAAATTLTFKELEKGSTFKHVRNTKTANRRSLLTGDLIVFTNPIADAAGRRIGRLYATCTATAGNKSFLEATMTCTAVFTLRGGSLMVQTNTSPGAGTTTGAVVGGTGAYAGARGVLVSKEARGGSDDTITFAG
jgi:hypothetical protein